MWHGVAKHTMHHRPVETIFELEVIFVF